MYLVRITGSATATLVEEEDQLPQVIEGLAPGSYQIGRATIAWSPDDLAISVSAETPYIDAPMSIAPVSGEVGTPFVIDLGLVGGTEPIVRTLGIEDDEGDFPPSAVEVVDDRRRRVISRVTGQLRAALSISGPGGPGPQQSVGATVLAAGPVVPVIPANRVAISQGEEYGTIRIVLAPDFSPSGHPLYYRLDNGPAYWLASEPQPGAEYTLFAGVTAGAEQAVQVSFGASGVYNWGTAVSIIGPFALASDDWDLAPGPVVGTLAITLAPGFPAAGSPLYYRVGGAENLVTASPAPGATYVIAAGIVRDTEQEVRLSPQIGGLYSWGDPKSATSPSGVAEAFGPATLTVAPAGGGYAVTVSALPDTDGGTPVRIVRQIRADGATSWGATETHLYPAATGVTAVPRAAGSWEVRFALTTEEVTEPDPALLVWSPAYDVTVSAAVTVDAQAAEWGALTPAGTGGWRPYDSLGRPVDLTAVNAAPVSGSLGAYVPSIAGGRLVFTGGTGAPAGVVLQVTPSGHAPVNVTIATVANAYDVASYAELKTRLAAITDGYGRTIRIRGGEYEQQAFAAAPVAADWLRMPAQTGNAGLGKLKLRPERAGAVVLGKFYLQSSTDLTTAYQYRPLDIDGLTFRRAPDPANEFATGGMGTEFIVNTAWVTGVDIRNCTITHTVPATPLAKGFYSLARLGGQGTFESNLFAGGRNGVMLAGPNDTDNDVEAVVLRRNRITGIQLDALRIVDSPSEETGIEIAQNAIVDKAGFLQQFPITAISASAANRVSITITGTSWMPATTEVQRIRGLTGPFAVLNDARVYPASVQGSSAAQISTFTIDTGAINVTGLVHDGSTGTLESIRYGLHTDFLQLDSPGSHNNLNIHGNLIARGLSDLDFWWYSGQILSHASSGTRKGLRFVGNTCLGDVAHWPMFGGVENGLIASNTMIPMLGTGAKDTPVIRITGTNVRVIDNIAAGYALSGVTAGLVQDNNQVVPISTLGAIPAGAADIATYQGLFVDPQFGAASTTGWFTKWALKPGAFPGAARVPGAIGGAYDQATGVYTDPLAAPVPLTDPQITSSAVVGQPLNGVAGTFSGAVSVVTTYEWRFKGTSESRWVEEPFAPARMPSVKYRNTSWRVKSVATSAQGLTTTTYSDPTLPTALDGGRIPMLPIMGNSAAELDDYEDWLGRPADGTTLFAAHATADAPANMHGSINYNYAVHNKIYNPNTATEVTVPGSEWANHLGDRIICWSIATFTTSWGTLAGAAAATDPTATGNAYVALWRQYAIKLLAQHPTGPIRVRINWEFNLSHYGHAAINTAEKATLWIAGFRNCVAAMRMIAGSSRFVFEWCPNIGLSGTQNPELSYPGDDVVDLISLDFYYNGDDSTNGNSAWNWKRDQSYGLSWFIGFKPAKPHAIAECGVQGSAGSPVYLQLLKTFMLANDLDYVGYWANNGNYPGKLHPTIDPFSDPIRWPEVSAKFVELFGQPAALPAVLAAALGGGAVYNAASTAFRIPNLIPAGTLAGKYYTAAVFLCAQVTGGDSYPGPGELEDASGVLPNVGMTPQGNGAGQGDPKARSTTYTGSLQRSAMVGGITGTDREGRERYLGTRPWNKGAQAVKIWELSNVRMLTGSPTQADTISRNQSGNNPSVTLPGVPAGSKIIVAAAKRGDVGVTTDPGALTFASSAGPVEEAYNVVIGNPASGSATEIAMHCYAEMIEVDTAGDVTISVTGTNVNLAACAFLPAL